MGLPPPPEGIDLGADRAPTLVIVIILSFVLTTVAIIARILTRMLSENSLWLDDWLIVIYIVSASRIMCLRALFNDCSRLGPRRLLPIIQIVSFLTVIPLISETYPESCQANCAAIVIRHGVGRHVWAAPPDAVETWAYGFLIANVMYCMGFTVVKLSVLAFYWRVFGLRKSIRAPILVLTGMVIAWAIALVGHLSHQLPTLSELLNVLVGC